MSWAQPPATWRWQTNKPWQRSIRDPRHRHQPGFGTARLPGTKSWPVALTGGEALSLGVGISWIYLWITLEAFPADVHVTCGDHFSSGSMKTTMTMVQNVHGHNYPLSVFNTASTLLDYTQKHHKNHKRKTVKITHCHTTDSFSSVITGLFAIKLSESLDYNCRKSSSVIN